MDRLINQFRRIGYDKGQNDVDFTDQEAKLKASTDRLTKATQDLVRASEHLNNVALGIDTPDKLH